MSNVQPLVEQAKPQPTKEELERKKIELEIKDLERPFWKRPTYILSALPTILAIIGLLYGFANGYFSATSAKLEAQKLKLETDISKFETTKKELNEENEKVGKENENLRKEKGTVEGQVTTLEQKRLELEGINNNLSQQNDNLSLQKNQIENKLRTMSNDFDKVYSYTEVLLKVANELDKTRGISKERHSSLIPFNEPGNSKTITEKALDVLGILERDNTKAKIKELTEILQRIKKEQKK